MSARSDFADVLKWARTDRNIPPRECADRLGVNLKTLARFEDGDEIPNGATWSRYRNMVNKALRGDRFTQLYSKARSELSYKPFENALPVVAIDTTQVASIAAQHEQPVIAPPVPPAPIDQYPGLTKAREVMMSDASWRTADSKAERQAYARELFDANPDLDLKAAHEALQEKYKFSLVPETLREIKHKARDAFRKRENTKRARDQKPARLDIAPTSTPAPVARTAADEIQAACELVLGAVPNLRTFTISVDDAGEAHVNYSVREVRVIETSGNLKIGKRS